LVFPGSNCRGADVRAAGGVADKRLAGRVAIVSGATKEVGAVLMRRLSDEGAAVVGVGRSAAAGEAVARTIREQGGQALFHMADVSRESEVQRAVKSAVAAFGGLHIIVNNAAATDILRGSGERPVIDEPSETFDRMFKVNVYAPFWFAKYGLPHLIAAGGGAIVSVSSISANRVDRAMPGYVASKAALDGLTRQIATDYAEYGVRVNAIALGTMLHSETERLFADPAQNQARAANRMIERPGTPADLANMVAFLVSNESAFVTGAVIPLDGGAMAKYPAPDIGTTTRAKDREDA
jgi:NAD(P)-dependent dehydrogenase (short-subunit alcohol dehydrogenase family)